MFGKKSHSNLIASRCADTVGTAFSCYIYCYCASGVEGLRAALTSATVAEGRIVVEVVCSLNVKEIVPDESASVHEMVVAHHTAACRVIPVGASHHTAIIPGVLVVTQTTVDLEAVPGNWIIWGSTICISRIFPIHLAQCGQGSHIQTFPVAIA